MKVSQAPGLHSYGFERYGTEVFGYAILGDRSPGFRPGPYEWRLGKARLVYEYEVAKILDHPLHELEASDNPAALLLLAHHYTGTTKNEQTRRRKFKLHLTRLLFSKGYDPRQAHTIFKVVDWMMRLGREQAIIFTQEVVALRKDPDMSSYVHTFEWVFTELGIEKGLEQGTHRGAERVLRSQLARRFGELPSWVAARLAEASADTIERWSLQLLEASSLEEVFA